MKKNASIAALLFLVIALSAYFLYSSKVLNPKLTRVTVSGSSQASVAPDNAVVTFSVITKDKQAVTAQQQNAAKSDAVINALKSLAPANAEIKTDNYRLDSEQNYSSDSLSKILGYEARNSITVITPDLNQVGALIDAATKAGANGVDGINFVLREDSRNRGSALGIATRQAMAKAEAIADSLGGKIYRVIEAQEGGTPSLESSRYNNLAVANAAANTYRTPISAGSLELNASILLIVEIETK